MADNIKQIKVEGVSYDLNAKYIQDGSGNPKTWQNIADMINAGVKLVTDNARKEAAGDGAIDTTVSITDTAGAPLLLQMVAVLLLLLQQLVQLLSPLLLQVHILTVLPLLLIAIPSMLLPKLLLLLLLLILQPVLQVAIRIASLLLLQP